MSSGLRSNSPRKTATATVLYFPAEEDCAHIRKKNISVNGSGQDLDAVNFIWKRLKPFIRMTVPGLYWQLLTAMSLLDGFQK